ncbi:MAG: Ig-like domain-containing protein [Lachnospiraceae bacterium]|nr:Ig-like domain-containing protein [Lachnospiraceae bacterium]
MNRIRRIFLVGAALLLCGWAAPVCVFGMPQTAAAAGDLTAVTGTVSGEETETTAEPETTAVIPVTDLDIADVQSPMTIGTSQVLSVMVIPEDASDATITFTSLTPEVASVNALGRVTALSAGTARIQIEGGTISRTIKITVEEEETESEVHVTAIDVDYEETMTVGTTQTLSPSVLPVEAAAEFSYLSSAPSVAEVNAFGKVTALAAGKATITISADGIKKKITIQVEAESVVTSIDVSDFEEEMEVDSTQTLSVSLYPADAEDQTVTYASSNSGVASVSQGGVITAVSQGSATITVSAGAAVKKLSLTVYVPTDAIRVSESYLVLTPGTSHTLTVSVLPEDADQEISYESTNENVATVDADGKITAVGIGETSIVLSNRDSMKAVTVIVHEENAVTDSAGTGTDAESVTTATGESLAEQIARSEETIFCLAGEELSTLTADILKALYQYKKTLCIQYEEYNLTIRGADIRNAGNSLSTLITTEETDEGISFLLNDGQNLPGTVEVELLTLPENYRYLYLFNESTGKYERLNTIEGQTLTLSQAGEYRITVRQIKDRTIPLYLLIGLALAAAGGTLVYVLLRKKYLFW